jgi:sugar phosphate isomerase/epimerase
LNEGIPKAYTTMKGRIRSTHLHDNNGTEDNHFWPFFSEAGTINWKETMQLLRSQPEQYPLLLELREFPEHPLPQSFEIVKQIFEKLETV